MIKNKIIGREKDMVINNDLFILGTKHVRYCHCR